MKELLARSSWLCCGVINIVLVNTAVVFNMSSPDSSEHEVTDVKPFVGNKSPKEFSPVKYYKQAYRKDWELMPDFKDWLSCVPGEPTRAYCKFCEKTLHAHRLSLLKHTCTLKHTRAAKNDHNNKKTANSSTKRFASQTNEKDSPEPATPVNVGLKEVVVDGTPNDSHNINVDTLESEPDEPMDTQPNSNTKDGSKSSDTPQKTASTQQQGKKVIITEVQPSQSSPEATDDGHITTHVLDTAKGRPIAGIMVSLYKLVEGRWTHLGESMTNPDGRCAGFVKKPNFVAGRYKLHFDVDRYYEYRRIDFLYPFIEIVFDVRSPQEHYHIPLLLSPYGYTTYKGS